jgi:hypothetical protein
MDRSGLRIPGFQLTHTTLQKDLQDSLLLVFQLIGLGLSSKHAHADSASG